MIQSDIFNPVQRIHKWSDFTQAQCAGMAITFRGPNGSGKSTVVRRIMELYSKKCDVYLEGEKSPFYSFLSGNAGKDLVIIGPYETVCGGCDRLKISTADIYQLVSAHALAGRNVIYEGYMVALDVKHSSKLKFNHHVIFLTTSPDECINSVVLRRTEAGNTKEYNPKNVLSKSKQLPNAIRRLKETNTAFVHELNREEAFLKTRELLCV